MIADKYMKRKVIIALIKLLLVNDIIVKIIIETGK